MLARFEFLFLQEMTLLVKQFFGDTVCSFELPRVGQLQEQSTGECPFVAGSPAYAPGGQVIDVMA